MPYFSRRGFKGRGFAPVLGAFALGLSGAFLLEHRRRGVLRGRAGRLLRDARAAIFDIDGTIVDSVDQHAHAWQDAFRDFVEKPLDPPGTPDDPEQTFVSMGNYIFTTKVLIDAIRADADDDHSDHDMGGDIIPRLVDDGMAAVYDFSDNEVPGATDRDRAYWRDVGTLDAFYDAHMDLVSVHPVFNLYNKRWPIRGESENLAPAKFVNGGSAQESVVGAGSIISAASVRNSVLSSNVVVDDGAIVEGGVIMPGARVGRGAVVRHAILDKNVVVGPGEMVGVDLERDRERFAISAGGVVAVGKGTWI